MSIRPCELGDVVYVSITQIISIKVNKTQAQSPKTLYHYKFKNKDAKEQASTEEDCQFHMTVQGIS